jgi:CBS domain-containing protein
MSLNDPISVAMKKDTPAVAVDDTLRTVIKKMSDNGVTSLLVKSGKDLVGIVTEMDVMTSIVNKGDPDAVKVSGLMTACELITAQPATSPCVQLDEGETMMNALAIMREAGVRNLVVADGDTVKGIISARDILSFV